MNMKISCSERDGFVERDGKTVGYSTYFAVKSVKKTIENAIMVVLVGTVVNVKQIKSGVLTMILSAVTKRLSTSMLLYNNSK